MFFFNLATDENVDRKRLEALRHAHTIRGGTFMGDRLMARMERLQEAQVDVEGRRQNTISKYFFEDIFQNWVMYGLQLS